MTGQGNILYKQEFGAINNIWKRGDNKQMVPEKEYSRFLLLLCVCLLALSTMGCLDIALMGNILPPNEQDDSSFGLQLKKDLSYYFNTSIMGFPSQGYKEMVNQEFRVLEKTQWMKIKVSVNLDKSSLVDQLIEVLGINESLTRNVDISLVDPDDNVVFHQTFHETETLEPVIYTEPMSGIWSIDIFAKGVGGEIEGFQTYDGFSVEVLAFEPV